MTLEEDVAPPLDGPDGAPLDAVLALADIPLLPRDPLLNPSDEENPWDVDGAELTWEVAPPDAPDAELLNNDEDNVPLEEDGETWEVPATLVAPEAARDEDRGRDVVPEPPEDDTCDAEARLLPTAPELPPPVLAHQPSTQSKPSAQSAGDWQLKRAPSAFGSGHANTTGRNAATATQRNRMGGSVPDAQVGERVPATWQV